MIIKIEDAPAVKHITIDIDFTGDGATTVIQDGVSVGQGGTGTTNSLIKRDDTLNLNEDFGHKEEEVVSKPEINIGNRAVKVSEDMQNMEI